MYKNVENKVRKIYYFLEIYIMENVSDHVFFSRAGYSGIKDLTTDHVKVYIKALTTKQFEGFDQYHNIINNIWKTCLNRNNYLESVCSCPAYLKNYFCKHIIGVDKLEKLVTIPNDAKSLPIGQKASAGRPPLAKKAYHHQDAVQSTTSQQVS